VLDKDILKLEEKRKKIDKNGQHHGASD